MPLRRYVLVLHSGALGDFVLSWPMILAVARTAAQSRIVVVTSSQKGALAEAALRVESADAEAGWHTLFADSPVPRGRAESLLAGARAVYSFVSAPGDVATTNLRQLASPAAVVPLRPTPRGVPGWSGHASQFLLGELATAPAPGPVVRVATEQILNSIASRGLGHAGVPGGDVVVHPGSGSPDKNWPTDRFVSLLERLRGAGRTTRVILGEAELERMPAAEIAALEHAAGAVRRPPTLIDLMNELRTAAAVVVNDSGPGHLAGILGLPTVSLFGPTDPAVWKPLGPRVRVVARPEINQIEVSDVMDALTAAAPAR